jgi:hypothetical protein
MDRSLHKAITIITALVWPIFCNKTHTATGVLGTTRASQVRSLKFVLKKHKKVKAPRTVMAKANNWFKRVRAEYIFTRCALVRTVPKS